MKGTASTNTKEKMTKAPAATAIPRSSDCPKVFAIEEAVSPMKHRGHDPLIIGYSRPLSAACHACLSFAMRSVESKKALATNQKSPIFLLLT
jgi:hypothetical protein